MSIWSLHRDDCTVMVAQDRTNDRSRHSTLARLQSLWKQQYTQYRHQFYHFAQLIPPTVTTNDTTDVSTSRDTAL